MRSHRVSLWIVLGLLACSAALAAGIAAPAAPAANLATITGRVLDPAGLPLSPAADAQVTVFRASGNGELSSMWQGAPDPAGYFSAPVYPDTWPTYVVAFHAQLPTGFKTMWYDLKAYGMYADRLSPVDGETRDLGDVVLASGRIYGMVVSQSGSPVPGLKVEVLDTRDGKVCTEAVTDANGLYDLYQFPVADGVQHVLRVTDPVGAVTTTYSGDASTYASASRLTLHDGDDLWEVVKVPDPTAFSLTGVVRDKASMPAPGVTVEALDAGANVDGSAVTAADGSYAILGLPAGDYRLHFTDPDGPYQDLFYPDDATFALAVAIGLDVRDRTYQADMILDGGPNVAAVHGVVTVAGVPTENVILTCTTVANSYYSGTRTDNFGSYRLSLPAGTYTIRLDDGTLNGGLLNQWYDKALAPADAKRLTFAAGSDYPLDIDMLPNTSPSPTPTPTPTTGGPAARADGRNDSSAPLPAQAICAASDGDTLVIGERWLGTAKVFVHSDQGWRLQQELSPSSPEPNDYGSSVAISGDTLAVGDFYDDGIGADPGKVHIYTRSGGAWTLQQTLAPNGDAYRSFGLSVALSGDTLLVGAPYVKLGADRWAGCAYVFTRSGTAWAQRAKITCAHPTEDDYFGYALALQGGTAVVTANMKDTPARVNNGEAFVFTGSGADWTQRATLLPSDGDAAPMFGDCVALDGGTIVVGSSRAEKGGALYVYSGAGADWRQQARLTTSDAKVGEDLGMNVALQGDVILAAKVAEAKDPVYARGAGYVFRREGTTWRQDTMLRVPLHDATTYWSLDGPVAIAGGDFLVGSRNEPADGSRTAGLLHAFHPYIAGVGETITVPAGNGVLANDTGAGGAALTAALVSGVSRGALDLAADGSFSYTPVAGWAGDDTFTYVASCGDWSSDPTTVTITVRDVSAPNVSADNVPKGWVNSPVTVTLSASDKTAVTAIDYRKHRKVPLPWITYQHPFRVGVEGVTPFDMRARDIAGNSASGQFSVRVDTRRPVPQAPTPAVVRHGQALVIKYRITDARPGSPTADVEINILKGAKEVWNYILPGKLVNRLLTQTDRNFPLAKGKYKILVTAVDAAGNSSARPGVTTLTVN